MVLAWRVHKLAKLCCRGLARMYLALLAPQDGRQKLPTIETVV